MTMHGFSGTFEIEKVDKCTGFNDIGERTSELRFEGSGIVEVFNGFKDEWEAKFKKSKKSVFRVRLEEAESSEVDSYLPHELKGKSAGYMKCLFTNSQFDSSGESDMLRIDLTAKVDEEAIQMLNAGLGKKFRIEPVFKRIGREIMMDIEDGEQRPRFFIQRLYLYLYFEVN